MTVKGLLPADKPGSDDSFVKRLKTGTGKYSSVLIRVGRGCDYEEFNLLLFPLVVQSEYVRRHVETMCGEKKDGSTVTIELPHFPHDPQIFRLVQDFCCGVMEENDICTGNVVKLLATSEFLEMDSLKDRVWNFLEKNVLNSWRASFEVLATFDNTSLPGVDLDHTQQDCLFGRCKEAFLPTLEGKELSNNEPVICYNVTDLVHMAKRLPESVAERIYLALIAEERGLKAGLFALNFHTKTPKEGTRQFLPWFLAVPCTKGEILQDRPAKISLWPTNASDLVKWREELQRLLPDPSKRSLLILYLTKLVHPEAQVPVLGITIRSSRLDLSFVSGLLVEAAELVARSDTSNIAQGLAEHIVHLEMSVSQGLYLARNSVDQCDRLLALLLKFRFGTLLSIVRHFRSLWLDQPTILSVAKILDGCLAQHLKDKWYTGKEAFLIYREFPNEARASHEELFHVFQTIMKTNDLSSQEALELVKLLDCDKLSEDTVDRMFEEFQLDFELPFVKRFVGVQIVREKRNNLKELVGLQSMLVKQTDDLTQMTEDKRLLETKLKEARTSCQEVCKKVVNDFRSELVSVTDSKKMVERERDAMRRDLDEEKEKTSCQICLEQPRDALCLPCMHFLYCSRCLQQHHDRQSKTCPACRCSAMGVLKCNLSC